MTVNIDLKHKIGDKVWVLSEDEEQAMGVVLAITIYQNNMIMYSVGYGSKTDKFYDMELASTKGEYIQWKEDMG